MITSLAKKRIRYNKSRSLLTIIAIALTTTLLMALGTSAVGLLNFNKQQASAASNAHATIKGLTGGQLEKLKNHADIESLETNEIFATIEYGKMNGYLTYSQELKGGIESEAGNIIEGRDVENSDEIVGSKAFFERMNVEPEVGNTFSISFRVNGEGEIQTRDFTISGIVSERDMSKLDVSDSRIAYGAKISGTLVEEMIPKEDRTYDAVIRVTGEGQLNYDEICQKINSVAEDIGISENYVNINKDYLVVATDPGTETIQIVTAVALLIVVFSGMVIYSIYYVGVITDVQEIGKLKAIGASKKQIRKLLLREGMFISAVSIPAGLILGFLIPYIFLPKVMEKGMEVSVMSYDAGDIHMFSLPVLAAVIVVVLLTVYISLLKPMRMAGKVSPVEAMRYQESSNSRKYRKGYGSVNVFRLAKANLVRNKKRTVVTMVTMGLSCVLFMSMAGILNSMRAEDIADRELEGNDFKIELDYDINDETYPENNLDNINKNNPFSDDLLRQILELDGVEGVNSVHEVPVSSDFPSSLFDEGRITISDLSREKAESYKDEIEKGSIDYSKLVEDHGAVFTSDSFMDEYGFEIGDEIDFTVYDGDRQIPLTVTIQASVDDGGASTFVIPEETYESMGLENNSITELFVAVDDDRYDDVKEALSDVADSNERFSLYSRDEEMDIGAMSVSMVKYPMYAILLMIAVIGFMNLINTMITSIVTRKKELGMLQAIGLSDRQMTRMLSGEGLVFTAGTLAASLTLGNIFGYLIFLWGRDSGFMSVTEYHYPVWESLLLALVLVAGQLLVTWVIGRRMRRESLIDRIRNE
ncbi:MAG: ABC transporter permease [Anaerovoracaceae bacterium]